MALDSAAKRCSALHFLMPGYAKAVIPAGTVDQADRQDVIWCYRGISAAALVTLIVRFFALDPKYQFAALEPKYQFGEKGPKYKFKAPE